MPSTCVVNSLGDAGVGIALDRGDLRFCLSQADAHRDEDLIVFSVTGTIKLTKALPDISADLIIAGPGADQLTVNAQQKGRVLTIDAGVTAQVYSVTLTGGSAAYAGGVLNRGTLTAAYVVVAGNQSMDQFAGAGGISNWSNATLTVFASAVTANTGLSGGGIANINGGNATVLASTVSGNLADAWGGGIYNATDGTLTLDGTTVAGNHAEVGGGIRSEGFLTVNNSTISGNDVSGNFTPGGGIEAVGTGRTTISNSTISGNRASGSAGGIYVDQSSVTIEFCTIAGNVSYGSGGGIFAIYAYPTLRDTIVAGNAAAEKGPDMKGGLKSSAYNLFGNIADIWGYSDTDLYNVDPLLGPLQDNGGPTFTNALLPGSPAIDSGDNTDAPEWDQRGPGYPRIVNGTIDRGAFEVQNAVAPASDLRTLGTADLSGAPTGRNTLAQANGLGSPPAPDVQALRGRHNLALTPVPPVSPLQGFPALLVRGPRALPWAGLFGPFGAADPFTDLAAPANTRTSIPNLR
jgi:hypothetical protein